MSAAGQYIPPLLIFPQKKWQAELLDGAPPGSIGGCSDSGWITLELFAKWFEHFISLVKPTPNDPVVLVLDGHSSHVRNIHVIERAREAGVLIVCLPPHSSNRMQPLDVTFMGPLKTFYAKAIENWLANHPNRIVRKLQIASIFGEAYMQAATMSNAVNGFAATGIFPYQPDKFKEIDFLTATQECHPEAQSSSDSLASLDLIETQPSTSNLLTVPVITPSTSSRAGSAFLVTSSPHKEKILLAELKKKIADQKKTK